MDLSPLKPQEWLDEDIGWRRQMIEAANAYNEERSKIMNRKRAKVEAEATSKRNANARMNHG